MNEWMNEWMKTGTVKDPFMYRSLETYLATLSD